MTKSDLKKVKNLIHSIGLQYNLSDDQVKKIIESPYDFAKIILESMDLENVKDKEDLDSKKTNFNFKALGKLYINHPSFERREKQKAFITNLNKNKK